MKPVVVNIHKLPRASDGKSYEKNLDRSVVTRTKLVTTESNMKSINEDYKEHGNYYEFLKENTINYKKGLGKNKTPMKKTDKIKAIEEGAKVRANNKLNDIEEEAADNTEE